MSDLQVMLRIKADGSGASAVIRNAKGELIDLGKAADASAGGARNAASAQRDLGNATAETGRSAGVASRAWAGLGAAVGALGFLEVARQVIVAGNALNGMQAALTAVTGTGEQAAEEIAFVRAEAQRLGVDLQVAAKSYTSLAAAAKGTTLEGRAAREIFIAVAEAGRVMNLSAADTEGTLRAVQQIISKGTVSAEELRGQLGERLPGAFQVAARAMGVTTAELGKMLEAGELTAEEFLPKFAAELRNVSSAGLEAARNSPAAEFTRLKNAVFELAGAIAQSGLLDLLGEVARNLTDLIKVSSDAVRALSALRDGLQTLDQAQAESDARQRQWTETSRLAAETARRQAETQTRSLAAVRAELLTNQRALERVVRVQGQESALAEELIAKRRLLLAELQRATKAANDSGQATEGAGRKTGEAGRAAERAAPQVRQFGVSVGEVAREAIEAVDPLREFNARIDDIVSAVEDARVDRLAADMAQLQIALEDALSQGNVDRAARIEGALVSLSEEIRTVPDAAAEVTEAFDAMSTEGTRLIDDLSSVIADGLVNGFEGAGDSVRRIFANLLRDLISTALRNRILIPIQTALSGGGGGGGLGALFGGGGGQGGQQGGASFGGINFGGPGASAGTRLGLGAAGVGIAYQGYQQGNPLMGAAGGALTGFQIAGPIGAIIGAALGGLAAALNDTTRRITIIGSELVGTAGFRNLAPDAIRQSALGGFAFASIDNVPREERDQLAQAIQQFDASIAQLLDEEQLQRVKDAVAQVNTQATEGAITADTFIRQRFDAVLSTMSDAVRAFVAEGETFEDQVQRLGQALQFPREIQAVIDGFAREDLLANMTELERRTFEVNERFDAAIEYLRERSATEEQLAQVEEFRARALAALTEATEDSIDSIVRNGQGLARMLGQLRFDESLVGLSDLDRALALLARELEEAIIAAQGMGATEAELAEIREIYAARRTRIERQASEQALDAAADYWAQIAAYNQQAMQQVSDAIRNAFGGLADWLRGEVFSETSTLTPEQQFEAAQQQFQDILRRAAAGDTTAAQGIQGAAQQLLQQGLSFLGGGDAWRQLREAVLGALGPLAALGQSGSADGGALQGGPAAALRRFLELMRGFGLGAIGAGGLGFGPAANGTLTVPQAFAATAAGGGSTGGNVLSINPLVLDRSLDVQDRQLQRLVAVESRLESVESAIRAAGDAQVSAIDRLAASAARFG